MSSFVLLRLLCDNSADDVVSWRSIWKKFGRGRWPLLEMGLHSYKPSCLLEVGTVNEPIADPKPKTLIPKPGSLSIDLKRIAILTGA